MDRALSASWWAIGLRGLAALLFGILALMVPGLTLLWLVALFAAFALLGGGAWVAGAIRNRKHDEDWWLMLLLGLVSLGAGAIAIFHPAITALVLVLMMGANAIVTGVLDIAIAIRLRRTLRGEWLLIVAGSVSIVFGVLVFLFPGAGALALVWLISVYAIATGVLLLAVAWQAHARGQGGGMRLDRQPA